MGKAGRVACITIPWLLTVGSFVCLALIEAAGWNSNTLTDLYFFQANFTSLTIPNADSDLAASLQNAKKLVGLAEVYNINLWNYCSSNKSSGVVDYCSGRTSEFYFDPIQVWGLNSTQVQEATGSANLMQTVEQKEQDLEDQILGTGGKKALEAYKTASKWMWIAYQVSLWTTLATIILSIFAIFSRIGSLLTWILSVISTLFTFGAVLTSTILFSILVGALKGILDKYKVTVSLSTHTLAVSWLAVALSIGATFFWLFSICCCSGRSNPHHKSNKGGLWNAEPKGRGYGDYGRGRGGMRVEKTGGGYERVASPFLGGADNDRVPLAPYPQPQQQQYHGHARQHSAFEPYRHG